ncbi:hypothetical protein [Aquimarina sp. RZ0]|uniref:hypothetical protein n=1 Tax=Aquimarina sp. RZ0 TaxID=2607730 RepID=UPI0011F21262|nr:hypothetical protein [Aquimarina sp. RZ0]KAA1244926.1 hypothetical protein F0000_14390 [Aquimarina sp. RZ0]
MENVLEKFKKILCGTLDNQAQIDKERAEGQQIHPYAKHVTNICDHKIINRPKGHEGIYILEESYYTYPDKEMEIKPLLFYLRSEGTYKVLLQSMRLPPHINPVDVVNHNDNLVLDYNKLITSPFGIAEYTLQVTGQFTVNHIGIISPGITFQLTETLSEGHLSVLEILRKDGVKLTPYETPIDYIKIK